MCGYFAGIREAVQAIETEKLRIIMAAAEQVREAEHQHLERQLRIRRWRNKMVYLTLLVAAGVVVPWLPFLVFLPWLGWESFLWLIESGHLTPYGDSSLQGWRGYFQFVFW